MALLCRWFKAGNEVEPYGGLRSLSGFQKWVADKQQDGSL